MLVYISLNLHSIFYIFMTIATRNNDSLLNLFFESQIYTYYRAYNSTQTINIFKVIL